ncbi:MAG TPA: cytochrome c3 family protein [Bdellovibrionota bacterium]|nr:cytochrome c3 family protein [Bdellovibrionota bacterium]
MITPFRLLVLLGCAGLMIAWRLDDVPDRGVKSFRRIARFEQSKLAAEKMPPHDEMFKFTNLHGSQFTQNKALCRKCHGADLQGGVMNIGCTKCHPALEAFTHHESGDDFQAHPDGYFKNPSHCARCHGGNFEGKGGAMSCRDCHNFPHSRRWALASEHGAAYLKDKDSGASLGCLDCHGEKSEFRKERPDEFVSCGSCHPVIPHAEGQAGDQENWNKQGHAKVARAYEGQCVNCHTGSKKLMPNFEKGCRTSGCHPSQLKNWEPIMKWESSGQTLLEPGIPSNPSLSEVR